ncbi:MAG: ribonuclease H family protein [Lachnospiraceae bacterium]|nr:ribonuclease H family protein [Lachnospiraceae bacterium]
MSQKFYAVRKGKEPGVYQDWKTCREQISGFSGAVYKSFLTREEAEQFLEGEIEVEESYLLEKTTIFTNEETVVAYVDGSFEKIIGKYAYACVILFKGEITELSGTGEEEEYLSMNNVAGEILGSICAIQWAIEHQAKKIHIYYDYEGIARWADGDWKANKKKTKEYQEFVKESQKKIAICFTKVAAHTGVELNERADKLAKQALGVL